MILVTGRHLVLTPEKVVVSFGYASLGARIAAKIVDLIIVGAVLYTFAIGLAFLLMLAGMSNEASSLLLAIILLVTTFGFFLAFILQEILWNGCTVGKKMMNLRVMMVDGTPIQPHAAIYRNLVLAADFIPVIGVLCMFLTERSQRVGDLASGTIVVHEPQLAFGFRPAPHRYGLHPFEEIVPDLKGMTLEEYLAIKRLCDRFPELPVNIQDRSIEEIWLPFAERFKVPNPPNVHPIYIMEATVMKYGRTKNLV